MKRSGFTLIETLVYLALYAIIMSGAVAAAYSIFASSARNDTTAMVEEEGDYLLGKIDGSIAQAASIESQQSEGSQLALTLEDGSNLVVQSMGENVEMEIGDATPQTLNNSDVSITDLDFVHTLSSSDGIDPESIAASFTIHATTSDGRALSRDFSTLKYLRK